MYVINTASLVKSLMSSQQTAQQKCEAAIAAGKFDDEIVPVPVKVKKEIVEFKRTRDLVPEQQ